jgi:glycosyltransferase involved in cell wall biosynthesis
MNPSIAVITPTYNRVGSLGSAIDSILAQGHGDF